MRRPTLRSPAHGRALRCNLGIAACLALGITPGIAPAQSAPATPVTQPSNATAWQAAASESDARGRSSQSGATGYTIGSFHLDPSLQAASFYDDNIYATSHHHVSDWVGTLSPRLALQSDWDRNSLYAAAQTDLTGYWSHPHENSIDWHALAEGQIDISARTHILLGGMVAQEHEDRSSPDAVAGIEPTPYREQNAYAGVVQRFGDFSLRTAAAMERLTFGNVMGEDGEINNQDRNRVRYTLGGTLRYEKNRDLMPFFEAMGDMRRYATEPDDNGFLRNSDGFLAGFGSVFVLSPKVSGEVFLGVLHRTYRDPVFRPLTAPDGEATLRWRATSRTTVVLATERTIEETTLYGSPGYVYTLGVARLEQQLSGRLKGIVRLSYVHRDFAQVGTVDNDIGSAVGLRYRLSSRVTLGVDYRYTQRTSGTSLTDFSRQQVFFRISTHL